MGSNLSLLNGPAEMARDLHAAVAGDAFNNVGAVGHNEGDVLALLLDAKEPRGGEFLTGVLVLGVKVQGDAVALAARLVAPPDDRSVVTTNLGRSGAVGGGTVEVLHDERIEGVHAVVGVSREDEYAECVLARRLEGDLAAGAEDERADVEECVGGAWGNILGVSCNGEVDGFQESLFWDRGDGNVGRGVDDAGGVLLGAENVDYVVWGAVGWGVSVRGLILS
jgi:hypothetical protein